MIRKRENAQDTQTEGEGIAQRVRGHRFNRVPLVLYMLWRKCLQTEYMTEMKSRSDMFFHRTEMKVKAPLPGVLCWKLLELEHD